MNKKIILAAAAVTSFMTAFMGSAINIALPVIGKEFNISAVIVSWTATAYLLTTAVLVVPAGKLADINGRLKFFKYGIMVFTLGTLFSGLSFSGLTLIASRVVQGIGSSMMFSTGTALVVAAYPPNERGRVLGITIGSVYMGLSTGPFLGGIIADFLGWRYIFFITVIAGVIISSLISLKIKGEISELIKEKFDTAGAFVLALLLSVLMLGFSFLPGIKGVIFLLAAVIISIFFYRIENKKENPIFNFMIFRSNTTFTFSNIAALINYSATFAVGFLMSFYLQIVKGYTPKNAGIILVTQPVMMAIFSPVAGKISDRKEPQLVSSIGMGIITAGLILFIFLNELTPLPVILFNLALLGFGFALFSSPNSNAIMSSVERKHIGIASSIMSSMRLIGQMFSMGMVIVIFSIFIGNSAITKDKATEFLLSSRAAFILFSSLCFLGIFASLSRGKIHK